jgi:hypothetical protein
VRRARAPRPLRSRALTRAPRDEQEGSIITSMISQLRVGMDLSKVSFPTFVLEPRSMLERITDFMAHPDLIFGCAPCACGNRTRR